MDNLTINLVNEARARNALPPPAVRRLIRQRAQLTQAEIARALGVGRVEVTRYESGQRSPRPYVRGRYAELLAALATAPAHDRQEVTRN